MSQVDISKLTDEEIIALYQSGRLEVFRELVNRYTQILHNFVARIGGKDSTVDIVQETFIKAWRSLNKFDAEKASFKTWLFAITKNTSTDFLRKKKSILFSELEKNTDEDDLDFALNVKDEDLLPDEVLEKLQDAEMLNRTLEKLRQSYREVLVLHYEENLNFEEIGKILNKPLNTVKSQHHRAILELRELLSQS